MRRTNNRCRWRWSVPGALLLAALACLAGEEPVAELVVESGRDGVPAWSSLTYSKQRLGQQLTIDLVVSEPPAQSMTAADLPRPADPPDPLTARRPALLEASALSGAEPTELRIWFDAASGTVLQRERLRPGAEGSHKVYRFGREGATRLRLAPAGRDEAQGPPAGWSQRRVSDYRYDMEAAGCSTVTVPALLLVLLPRLEPAAHGVSRCVFASDALYRVWFEPRGAETLDVDYALTDSNGRHRVSGRRVLEKIALRIEPLGAGAQAADFELLELRGDIVLFLDRANGLPVRITGSRALVKNISVELSAATLGH